MKVAEKLEGPVKTRIVGQAKGAPSQSELCARQVWMRHGLSELLLWHIFAGSALVFCDLQDLMCRDIWGAAGCLGKLSDAFV